MRVVRKKTNARIRFGDINVGTVFTTVNTRDTDAIYMKINKNLSLNTINLKYCNATSCEASSIGTHEEVIIINGAFIEDGAELP